MYASPINRVGIFLRSAKQRLLLLAFFAAALSPIAADERAATDADATAEITGTPAKAKTPPPPPPKSTIKLKDGSIIKGDIVDMVDGKLRVKTEFGGEVPVQWSQVAEIYSELKLRLILADDTAVTGSVEPGDDLDSMTVNTAGSLGTLSFPLTAVNAINPPKGKKSSYKGNINAGFNMQDGNTNNKSFTATAELIVRADVHRVSLRGLTSYAEQSGEVNARNSRGSVKYDLFFTERFYWLISALFEQDSFQDLNLRTALSTGLGYQVLEKGDFDADWSKEIAVYAEAGASYFSEDFDGASADEQRGAGRWALNIDWPVIPAKMTLFHNQEGFPSAESLEEIYLITEQGIRFNLLKNFISTLQVNWRWNNAPAPDTERSDTAYLFTLGYTFDK